MTNRKAMLKDIAKAKARLIERYHRQGICENFGEDEVRKLRGKYGIDYTWQHQTQPIDDFDHWAMSFTGKEY